MTICRSKEALNELYELEASGHEYFRSELRQTLDRIELPAVIEVYWEEGLSGTHLRVDYVSASALLGSLGTAPMAGQMAPCGQTAATAPASPQNPLAEIARELSKKKDAKNAEGMRRERDDIRSECERLHGVVRRLQAALTKSSGIIAEQDEDIEKMRAEIEKMRAQLAEARASAKAHGREAKEARDALTKVCTDVNYEGGVQYWEAKVNKVTFMALQLWQWIESLHLIVEHSGKDSLREWHGGEIGWLYAGQAVYIGEKMRPEPEESPEGPKEEKR